MGHLDLTAIGAMIVTAVLSIGGVAVWLGKFMPKVAGWIALAKDAVETVSDISNALLPDTDGKVELTSDEIKKINDDAIAFKAKLAVLLGK